jgi:hypothetical protein
VLQEWFMNRHGELWTAAEILRLYRVMFAGHRDSLAVAKIMGRSERAVIIKLQKGAIVDKNIRYVLPVPNELSFYQKLKKARQFELPEIPPAYRAGKLRKIFQKTIRHIEAANGVPLSKQHLIPVLKKGDARKKYGDEDKWRRFANEAQANPFMRSSLYKAQRKVCELCNNPLSEADYQLHHKTYDHVCAFSKKIEIILRANDRRSVPNCEACFEDNQDRFKECAARLCAVHGLCNKRLN